MLRAGIPTIEILRRAAPLRLLNDAVETQPLQLGRYFQSYCKGTQHMSNRHERRKAAKIGTTEKMSYEQLDALPSGCAWDGCGALTKSPDEDGWSKMILYKGETTSDFLAISANDMQRDCVLCPQHARQLDDQLLVNIGGQFRMTMGTA
jgi:hypothetical protein